jgi:AraC family transcriptional regulator
MSAVDEVVPPTAVVPSLDRSRGHIDRQWVSDFVTVSVLRYTAAAVVRRHTHRYAFVTLLLRGSYRETLETGAVTYLPLSAVYHPDGIAHEDEVGGDGADVLTIELGPSMFGGLRRKLSGIGAVRDLTGSAHVWRLLAMYADLAHAIRTPLIVEEPMAELLDALDQPSPRRRPRQAPWMARVVQFIRESYREPISLADCAREAQVHPVHLSRVYRRMYGRPIRESLHRLRVVEACRLVRSGTRSIAEIAHDTGFHDPAYMTAVCRQMTALSPAGLRRLLAGAEPGYAAASTARMPVTISSTVAS